MTEPKSSQPVIGPGATGRVSAPLGHASHNGPRDLLVGLGVLSLILCELAILGRVAMPLNFALAALVASIVGALWLLTHRTAH